MRTLHNSYLSDSWYKKIKASSTIHCGAMPYTAKLCSPTYNLWDFVSLCLSHVVCTHGTRNQGNVFIDPLTNFFLILITVFCWFLILVSNDNCFYHDMHNIGYIMVEAETDTQLF